MGVDSLELVDDSLRLVFVLLQINIGLPLNRGSMLNQRHWLGLKGCRIDSSPYSALHIIESRRLSHNHVHWAWCVLQEAHNSCWIFQVQIHDCCYDHRALFWVEKSKPFGHLFDLLAHSSSIIDVSHQRSYRVDGILLPKMSMFIGFYWGVTTDVRFWCCIA